MSYGASGEQAVSPTATNRGPVVTDADFAPEVAARHRRLDASNYDGVYVVGDVHGCRRELEALLEDLEVTDDDLVVFVGDLVRKGPDSRGVVELVRSQDNFVSVRGNNEDKLIHGREQLDALATDPHESYLDAMPVVVSFDDAMVVHGGVDPRSPLDGQTVEGLLNCRAIPPENGYDGPFWHDTYEGPPRVFFGHTVLEAPLVRDHAVGLDTGCVYGGELTAYDYRADELASVEAFDTYQQRPDEKFLAPDA